MFNSIGIIGIGKLGSALALAMNNINKLDFIICNSADRKIELSHKLSSDVLIYDHIRDVKTMPELLFITVQDSHIEDISKIIAHQFKDKLQNTTIVHCAGSLGIEALQECSEFCKATAKIHPYQTFYNLWEDVFDNVAWLVECSKDDKQIIKFLLEQLKGQVFFADEISGFNYDKYHISAVFSANYLSSSIKLAELTANLSGIKSKHYIPKISLTALENSINNLDKEKSKFPLTGPIARGDLNTLEKHILALKSNTIEHKGYVLFGLATTELAFSENLIDSNTYELIKNIFVKEIKALY